MIDRCVTTWTQGDFVNRSFGLAFSSLSHRLCARQVMCLDLARCGILVSGMNDCEKILVYEKAKDFHLLDILDVIDHTVT